MSAAPSDLTAAVVLGDVDRVRAELARDPAVARQPDPGTGRTPLHCAAARASAGFANEEIMRLLLEHGARVEDDDLYLAGFSGDHDRRCLRLLLQHTDVAAVARRALSAPISTGDSEGVRVLLDAGADPRLYARVNDDNQDEPTSAIHDALQCSAPIEIVELLLDHGADPEAPGSDGRTSRALAEMQGRADVVELLKRHGAADSSTAVERFLGACRRADPAAAERELTGDPGLLDRLGDGERAALVDAAEAGNRDAVALLLDAGIPIGTHRADGATALHAAAYAGAANVVALLLQRGADIDLPDTHWQSPALEWAVIGSGQQRASNGGADWMATVRVLVDAGASTAGLSLDPDSAKPPSPEVARLLRSYGVR